MKRFQPDERYNTIAIYALAVIAFGIVYAVFLANLDVVFAAIRWFLSKGRCLIYSLFFSLVMLPLVKWFEHLVRRSNRYKKKARPFLTTVISVIFADLVLLIILALIIFALVPALGSAYTHFSEEVIPQLIGLRDRLAGGALSEITLPVYDATYNYIKTHFYSDETGSLSSVFMEIARNIANETSGFLLGAVLGTYFLMFRTELLAISRKIMASLFTEGRRTGIQQTASRIYNRFVVYFSTRIVLSLGIALCVYLLCLLFRVPLASLVAFIAFAANIIPILGPLVAVVVTPLLIAVAYGGMYWPIVFLIMAGLQIVVSALIEPALLRKSLRPKIGITVTVIIIGLVFFGFLGMILAVPVYASLNIPLKEWQNRRLIQKNLPITEEAFLKLDHLE